MSSPPSIDTLRLHEWVDRMRAGDLAARDELLRAVGQRLEQLARKMLSRFPTVHRWVQTDDVLQNSLLRLLRALESIRPDSVRGFFALAAEQIRRELLDMVRHFLGPRGLGHKHESVDPDAPSAGVEAVEDGESREELERWTRFHEAVERLPPEEREVVGLIFYHKWTQVQVAELLQVNERTVRRRWESAMVCLRTKLGD